MSRSTSSTSKYFGCINFMILRGLRVFFLDINHLIHFSQLFFAEECIFLPRRRVKTLLRTVKLLRISAGFFRWNELKKTHKLKRGGIQLALMFTDISKLRGINLLVIHLIKSQSLLISLQKIFLINSLVINLILRHLILLLLCYKRIFQI